MIKARHLWWALLVLAVVGAAGPAAGQPREQKDTPGDKGKANEPDCSGFYWSWPTRQRAFLGVELLSLTDELRAHFGAPSSAGLLVARVEPGSPAARAGLRVGDLLVGLDGRAVGSRGEVVWAIRRRARGDRVRLKVIRGGKTRTLQATLEVRETPQVEVGSFFKSFQVPGGVRFEGRLNPGGPFDPRCLERAMQRLQGEMKRAQPSRRIFRFLEREEDLERRLQQMEQKLHKLERRVQGASGA